MNITIERYPDELRGGYYDGAKLIGTVQEGKAAEYYNPTTHGVVRYKYDPENERLTADFDPERRLPDYRSVREYIDRMLEGRTGFESLSPWARSVLEGEGL